MGNFRFTQVVGGGVLGLACSLASAALIVTPGNVPQIDDNVIFNACNSGVAIFGPATTVAGCLNTDHAQQVKFTAEENIIANGGQARVDAADTNGYQHLRIEVTGKTFQTLILNINSFNGVNNDSVVFKDNLGNTSGSFNLGNGGNFFTITGGTFSYIEFDTTVGVALGDAVQDTRQVRIGAINGISTGNPPNAVPVPGTLLLLGLGLAGLGFARRRS